MSKRVRYREVIVSNRDEFDLPLGAALVAGPFVHVLSHVPGSWLSLVSWIERTYEEVNE